MGSHGYTLHTLRKKIIRCNNKRNEENKTTKTYQIECGEQSLRMKNCPDEEAYLCNESKIGETIKLISHTQSEVQIVKKHRLALAKTFTRSAYNAHNRQWA